MTQQKILFFVIVGLAVMFVGLLMALNPLLWRWFGPPDLDATTTALAIRATDASLTATEVAIASTKAAIEAGETLPTAEATRHETGDKRQTSGTGDQIGDSNLTWEGLQIDITHVNDNAWPLVKAQNQFNDPPGPGKRLLMITVRVTHVEGTADEFIQLDTSDFRLIGSYNEIYTTWGDETRCGVVPDELNGVVAGNISLEGNVCFQIPLDEDGFKLIYEQRTGDYPAVYIDLP